ncbi:MAG: tetratricopeptide repeat protein [Firmicutes bacterium]|nr:tetratricopeptide repeat protein [Bacillota bacterium]
MSKINKKRPIYVLDTNVLLYNPRAVYAFPNADVVIPDIVLGELDKVKTSRADRELRYRSREISRILFELSENGKLTDGIQFGKNSVLRVISFDPAKGAPEMFTSKNSDDRILSIVYQIKKESNGREVTIVTNDLNMLLKAQTLDIKVEHPGEEFAYSGIKRALFKVKANKKTIWSTVAAVAAIALVVFFMQNPNYFSGKPSGIPPDAPPELQRQFQAYQNDVNTLNMQKDTYEAILKKNPKDIDALVGLGNIYFDLAGVKQDQKIYQKAIDNYKKALDIDPSRHSVRTDMAVAYYNLGASDIAIRELNTVIEKDPNFYQAYFNLGVIYQENNDPQKARDYFAKVVDTAPPESKFSLQAQAAIRQLDAQIKGHSKNQ